MTPSHPKNQRVHLTTAIPGPKSRELRVREDAHLAPGVQGYAVASGVAIESAVGSAVTDVDGNTLLDIIGGIGVNALGHSHPKMVRALGDQVVHASVGSFTTGARVELVERLAAHAPAPGVHRVQLYSSGAEAVESALRLAKAYTKKHEFVSFWGAFHGKTMGALSLMGSSFKDGLGPMVPGSHIVPYADCYRCPIGLTYPSCGIACAEVAKKQVKMQSAGAVAAVIVEPIQGTAGNIVPPDEFLPIVREMAHELGALFIADEMITGFGRSGKYWGAQHSGALPDIVTIGKAFGGGFPLSGLVTTDAIASSKPWSNPSGSSSSYGGNPLASAAGAAALRIIDEEDLVENSRVVGAALLKMLEPFVDDYPFVGTVRGRGLLIGMELVADKTTKQPLPRTVTAKIFEECVKRGLLTMAYAPSFRIQPPLTIDVETAANAVAILREVFDLFKAERLWEAR
jgi:4-aminobutyrate aminotransferase / (S)-3-amino-2-methylpropionate transaminase / 5-aminovalerate transaminase